MHIGQGWKLILNACDLYPFTRNSETICLQAYCTTPLPEKWGNTFGTGVVQRPSHITQRRSFLWKWSRNQKCCCLLWVKTHLKWTEAKWKTILWSDKVKSENFYCFIYYFKHPPNYRKRIMRLIIRIPVKSQPLWWCLCVFKPTEGAARTSGKETLILKVLLCCSEL